MFDELAPWLAGCDADVICLQEVTCTPGVRGWVSFGDGERSLPQRANLFDDVRTLLPDHQAMFVASDAGPVEDDTGARHRQDFGLGLFINLRYPVIGAQASFVHDDFLLHDAWPAGGRPRIAQAVRLADPSEGRSFTVAQLHGLRDRTGKGDIPQRHAQAAKLASLVTAVRGADDLTVVCGDFNLLPDSETFETLGRIGLVDLVHDSDTRTSRYRKPVRHASYLLVSDPAAVRSFEIVSDPEVSDHRPLALDI
jgi:endonuclease/exonuclease/phosphatase family metal-dependent hydrolase